MKEIIFFTVLIFTSIPAISNDICNCKGYDGPGGACYDGPGGPAYDGPGGPAMMVLVGLVRAVQLFVNRCL